MTIVEVFLILVGAMFILCSFFITEKLSKKDLEKIAELSEQEINVVMERELAEARAKIVDMVDESVDLSLNKINRELNKETDDKIMAIGEYSDTVMDSLNKTHNEVTFLYSMLNDKHETLTRTATEVAETISHYENLSGESEPGASNAAPVQTDVLPETALPDTTMVDAADEDDRFGTQEPETITEPVLNHNDEIMQLYKEGVEPVEIAKQLGIGFGEVSLVIGLFE